MKNNMLNKYSKTITLDPTQPAAQAMFYGIGFTDADFQRGIPVGVIGYKVSEELFGKAEKGLGKVISFNGRRLMVIGIIEKQGSSIIGGFDYDRTCLFTYNHFTQKPVAIQAENGKVPANYVGLFDSNTNLPGTQPIDFQQGVTTE